MENGEGKANEAEEGAGGGGTGQGFMPFKQLKFLLVHWILLLTLHIPHSLSCTFVILL